MRYDKENKKWITYRGCPITKSECSTKECAWWLDTAKQCTMTMIGYWMNENGNYEFDKREEKL
jgi:hypothetical protein